MSDLARALLIQLEIYRPALTQPSFRRLITLSVGWILTTGTHAITQTLVMANVAGRRHHEAFHRFFSRGTWAPDELGRRLFESLVRWVPDTISVVIDDTMAAKKGPHVFGLGCHLDAVRSTKSVQVFCFGHCWVTLAVLVRLPFSSRSWALPVLFRLYRNLKECEAKGHPYRKKTELARELVDVVLAWTGQRRVELVVDAAYCNNTVLRDLPPRLVVIGAMRPDAVLTALPVPVMASRKAGRPRVRGEQLPCPRALLRDKREPLRRTTALVYGRSRRLRYKQCVAQWYRACGSRLLRIVVVPEINGRIELRVFFSTDPSMAPRDVLEAYAGRWQIEVCFRNLKQLFGFADSSARRRAAVERTAPFVGLIYTSLVLWFADHAHRRSVAAHLVRPWYRHKREHSFADILRSARLVCAEIPPRVLDPARPLGDLHKSARRRRRAPATRFRAVT